MEATERVPKDDEEAERLVRVRVDPALARRLERLLDAPEFRFRDLEHLVHSALLSFAAFKEKELVTIREGGVWR